MSAVTVIDVETTGLNTYRHDRVVEIAAVVMQPKEGIQTDFGAGSLWGGLQES